MSKVLDLLRWDQYMGLCEKLPARPLAACAAKGFFSERRIH